MNKGYIYALIGIVLVVGVVLLLPQNDTDGEVATNTNSSTTNTSIVTNTSMKKNIVETAIADGSFTTLVSAVQAADLVETLSGEGPFTVFAPTDEAFDKLPAGTVEGLLENKEELAKVLTYHVVSGKVMAADVAKLTDAETVQGSKVTFDTTDGVKVNNATVIKADIETSNGVIHVIDTVLLP